MVNNRKKVKQKSKPLWVKVVIAWMFTPILFQFAQIISGVYAYVYLGEDGERYLESALTAIVIVSVVVEHKVKLRNEQRKS